MSYRDLYYPKINANKRYSLAIAVTMVMSTLFISVNTIANVFAYGTPIDSIIGMLCMGVLWVMALVSFFNELSRGNVVFFMAILLVFLVSGLLNMNLLVYFKQLKSIEFIAAMIMLCIGSKLKNTEQLFKYMRVASYIAIIASVIHYILANFYFKSLVQDNMAYAYELLLPTLFLYNEFTNKKGFFNALFSIIGIVSIVISGTRGPLICIFIYIVLHALLHSTPIKATLLVIISTLLLIFNKVFGLLEILLKLLSDLLTKMGFASRSLTMLLNKEFTSINSRDEIYKATIDAIKKRPLFGYGICGDRYAIIQQLGVDKNYAHNLFLEIWCDFGLILGTVLIIALGVLIYKAFKKSCNIIEKEFIMMLFSSSVIQLFMSASFITSKRLWLLVGYCFSILYKYKWQTEKTAIYYQEEIQ